VLCRDLLALARRVIELARRNERKGQLNANLG
jgi:hypothetical protein